MSLTHLPAASIRPAPRARAALAAGLGLCLAAGPVLAQTVAVEAPAPNFGGSVLQLFFGLAIVLGLLVGALWLLKQVTQRRGPNSALLKVIAGAAVGPRERVVIVEIGSTWLVLGVAPGRVNALAEVPRQGEPAEVIRRSATTEVPMPTADNPPAPRP